MFTATSLLYIVTYLMIAVEAGRTHGKWMPYLFSHSNNMIQLHTHAHICIHIHIKLYLQTCTCEFMPMYCVSLTFVPYLTRVSASASSQKNIKDFAYNHANIGTMICSVMSESCAHLLFLSFHLFEIWAIFHTTTTVRICFVLTCAWITIKKFKHVRKNWA